MKLYHYVSTPNTVLTEGILSFSKNPHSDLNYYTKRSGANTHEGIIKWMESCFKGRSRGIRLLIEPLQYTERTPRIKEFIENSDLFEVDISELKKDGLIDSVYVSPSVLEKEPENKNDEALYLLSDLSEIDFTPNDYKILDDEKGWRFAFIRYYLFIIKGGVIPSKYIKLIK
jgi:hypothetical protein